MFSKRKTSVAA